MQVNDLKNWAGKKFRGREGKRVDGRACLSCVNVWVRTCVSRCKADTCFPFHPHMSDDSKCQDYSEKLASTRIFSGHNCSAPSHGGPQSLTNSRTINPPILPSQLWNVFMLFCFTSALGPPLVFVCIWLIFTDKSPLETVQLPKLWLPLTVYEWSNTLLPTLLRLFVPTLIWLCFVDHFTD